MLKKAIVICVSIMLMILGSSIVYAQNNSQENKRSVSLKSGSSLTLQAETQDQGRFQWFKNGVAIVGATTKTFSVSEAGMYTVVVMNEGNCGSEFSDPVEVELEQIPLVPLFDLAVSLKSDEKLVGPGETFEYVISITNNGPNAARDIVVTDMLPKDLLLTEVLSPDLGSADYTSLSHTLSWKIDQLLAGQTARLRFRVQTSEAGTVQNTAMITSPDADRDLSNNRSTDTKKITGLKIPNVFTPNGDGVNDRFEIPGLALYPENELSIVNRWGNVVYEKKPYRNDWDGEGLNEGTYFYILNVKTTRGEWINYKGYLTILRSKP